MESDAPAHERAASAGAIAGLTLAERRSIVVGLSLAIFLAAMDQTILAVALVTIARDLHGFDLMPWLVSGYLVAATVTTPIYGKLSDLYGRRPLLLVAILIYLGAAVVAMFAQSAPQLLVLRIIQGLGAGGLLSLCHATIADIAPGIERARYQGIVSGVFGLAAVTGPVLGGYLTHYVSWRAVFGFNALLAMTAFLTVRRALRRLPAGSGGSLRLIDYPGALLLGAGLATLMIALTRLGQGWSWTAASTLSLFAASALFFGACAWRERRAPDPILPPDLFRNRTMVLCCVLFTCMFFVLVGMTVLLPMAMQAVGGAQTDEVALRMLPQTLGIPLGAFLSGRMMMRSTPPRTLMVVGASVTVVALLGIAFTAHDAPVVLAAGMLTMGLGLGASLPAAMVAMQSAVPSRQMGIATASSALFRTFGGAVGIAILTSILFAQLRLDAIPGARPSAGPILESIARLGPIAAYEAFRIAYAVAALAALIALAAAVALREPNPR